MMCSYNQLNGVPVCANYDLLTQITRHDWGLEGWACFLNPLNYLLTWRQWHSRTSNDFLFLDNIDCVLVCLLHLEEACKIIQFCTNSNCSDKNGTFQVYYFRLWCSSNHCHFNRSSYPSPAHVYGYLICGCEISLFQSIKQSHYKSILLSISTLWCLWMCVIHIYMFNVVSMVGLFVIE